MAESVCNVLHVFTREGATFTFRGVTIDTTHENAIVFTYKAMSDGRMKRGTFFTASLAGWSQSVE